ncbi:UDP-N-acetylmuramoyl-L-alanine--D-glutamate ligase [Ostreibacterium oceani]|uniref:UDP-N-acetylmuramoylalanine--D-glutamate ligase n=1 Tax=Ostreibacterium oceani TaxID=2654998 RepID=A0A6N7EUN8_9GAMM|nr:UDP-N-acetylmuramoyl-L-alanine--D-glutamate ligase [Ostreibacterium oceani]MPV86271.1 UDP-N-acetylmuramoyl-L-alanine--D-glutamate ligase [Ostreibacterium oceani]
MFVEEKLKQLMLPEPVAIIGAGLTGKSCFNLLSAVGIQCQVFDERKILPQHFSENPDMVALGPFEAKTFAEFATILVSPGVDLRRACFVNAVAKIITDIELFGRLTTRPVIGVTGSNGKSSVVSMLHLATQQQGLDYLLCGNIGVPVLAALQGSDDQCDGYIVELSSYHLERAPSLHLAIGTWLNVSPDHLDRYDSYADYVATKAKIFAQADYCVANAADSNVLDYAQKYNNVVYFSGERNRMIPATYHCEADMIYAGQQALFDMANFSQVGLHHAENIMAVFAMAKRLKIRDAAVVAACQQFVPLPSRSVTVGKKDGVLFINDSKGTNVGAAVAAIRGIDAPIILIAGGQGKGQDFSPLKQVCKNHAKHVLLMGEDAPLLATVLQGSVAISRVNDLNEAVSTAIRIAVPGDVVLLSPACASFDMFSSYLARGDLFEKIVREWIDA